MTLIASISREKLGTILLGDLLATSESDDLTYAAIPSSSGAANINQLLLKAGKRKISQLVQKLTLLSERMCIGVSGDASQAKDLIETLSFIANDKKLDRHLLHKIFISIEPNRINKIQFIGLIVEHLADPNDFCLFRFSSTSLKNKQYRGNVSAISAGSGTKNFEDAMPRFNWRATHRMNKGLNPHLLLNLSGLAVSSHFTGLEFYNGNNLGNAWGGGLEIVCFNNGKLQKLNDIVHLFIVVDEIGKSGKHRLKIRNKFVKYQYFHDLLMIRVIEVFFHKGSPPTCDDDLHLITPVHKKIADYDLKNLPLPSLKAKYLLCHVFKPNEFSIPTVKYDENFVDDFSIKLNGDKKMEMSISTEYLNEIRDILYKTRKIRVASLDDLKFI